MCNAAGCTFCAAVSAFGAFFMFLLGIMIKSGYKFVGEWYEPTEESGSPTEEQTHAASKSCFAVGGIYVGFTFAAIALTCFFDRKSKRS